MFSVVKGFAYKACFCLGLGTATYYSYGAVQKYVTHTQVNVVENVVEQHVNRINTVYDDTSPQMISYQPAVAQTIPAAPVVAEAPAVAGAPAAAPTEEKKTDDEKTAESGEKKDEENTEIASGVMGQPNPNYPAAYAPQMGHAPASTPDEAKVASAGTDTPMAPGALPSPTPSSFGSSSVGYNGSASSSSSIGTPVSNSGAVDANDIAALISPMKASFEDQINYANGLFCNTNGTDCHRKNHVPVYSLRWNQNEGLKKDVKFTVKSVGGTNLEFDFDFKIQNTAAAEEDISLTARPTDVLVHNETNGSKNYRVFEFKFADLSASGDTLNQVQATLVYEVTTTGMVLSTDSSYPSSLGFTRSKVATNLAKWDPTSGGDPVAPTLSADGTQRLPASSNGDVFLLADELSFSMNVEKSQ